MFLQKLRAKVGARLNGDSEGGFTLIELLVVILIVGILAAIALPTFLGQQKKGQDASAKSDARNLVSQVESCFTDTQTYLSCNKAALEADGSTGLSLVDGTPSVQGTVGFTPGPATNSYVIDALSKSGTHFLITKTAGGPVGRTCDQAAKGGCQTGGVW